MSQMAFSIGSSQKLSGSNYDWAFEQPTTRCFFFFLFILFHIKKKIELTLGLLLLFYNETSKEQMQRELIDKEMYAKHQSAAPIFQNYIECLTQKLFVST